MRGRRRLAPPGNGLPDYISAMSAPRQLTEMRLPDLGYNAYLCRYSEIALKGRNRASFERAAVANLKRLLEGLPLSVRRERGRVFLQPEPPGDTLTAGVVEALRRQTAKCFGLVSGSPAFLTAPELPAIEAAVDRSFGAVCAAVAAQLGEGMPIPYAMRARRSEHRLGMTSREIEIHFADRLLTRHPCLRVNLDNPLLRVEVEVRREHAFVSYERFPGPGGLPACTAGPGNRS